MLNYSTRRSKHLLGIVPQSTRHTDLKPKWLNAELPRSPFISLRDEIRRTSIPTVCEQARCPNIGECWNSGTATIMLLGDTCTRACRFCAIKTSKSPLPPDTEEGKKVVSLIKNWVTNRRTDVSFVSKKMLENNSKNEAFQQLENDEQLNQNKIIIRNKILINYIVLTTVDRDDLPDQGASHISMVVREILDEIPDIKVEALVGDFQGNKDLIKMVAKSGLHVFAHNLETVERLTPVVRDRRASYRQSLEVLKLAKESCSLTKTSLMLGVGEEFSEVVKTMDDIREYGVDFLTIGQYLRPTKGHMTVSRFVHPDEFLELKRVAMTKGFRGCVSGPLIRSSYKAGEMYRNVLFPD